MNRITTITVTNLLHGMLTAQIDQDERVLKRSKAPKGTTTIASTSFPPNIFSIMRYGHEVVRGSMKRVNITLEDGDVKRAMKEFYKLMEWSEMHKLMEEGNNDDMTPKGFFTVLDEKFDNIAVNTALREKHDVLEAAEIVLNAAMETDDLLTIQNAFSTYQDLNEAHLQDEEAVMMPKVAQMKADGVNLAELMKTELLELLLKPEKEFIFFIQHANRILQDEPKVTVSDQLVSKATVFDQALWAVATPKQWKSWNKWIKKSLKKETYKEVMAVIENSA